MWPFKKRTVPRTMGWKRKLGMKLTAWGLGILVPATWVMSDMALDLSVRHIPPVKNYAEQHAEDAFIVAALQDIEAQVKKGIEKEGKIYKFLIDKYSSEAEVIRVASNEIRRVIMAEFNSGNVTFDFSKKKILFYDGWDAVVIWNHGVGSEILAEARLGLNFEVSNIKMGPGAERLEIKLAESVVKALEREVKPKVKKGIKGTVVRIFVSIIALILLGFLVRILRQKAKRRILEAERKAKGRKNLPPGLRYDDEE